LRELVPMTNDEKASLPVPPANSLGAGPDGKLYAASDVVHRIDPDTGAATLLGLLPPGYVSSGDIAFLNGRMFISADGNCGGALVEFDLVTGTSLLLGGDFVVNCDGKIGRFDPDTGEAQILSTPEVSVYGADALP
jgi:hypothetical protein